MNIKYRSPQPAQFFEYLNVYEREEFFELETFLGDNPGLDAEVYTASGVPHYRVESHIFYLIYFIDSQTIYVIEAGYLDDPDTIDTLYEPRR